MSQPPEQPQLPPPHFWMLNPDMRFTGLNDPPQTGHSVSRSLWNEGFEGDRSIVCEAVSPEDAFPSCEAS